MQKSKGIFEKDIRNLEKLLHKAGEAANPKYRIKIKIKPKGKAIWNEQIEKASKQSKNAYKVWRQHGAPQERSNELKIKMTAAKRILRKAQRQAYQREYTAGKITKASNADTKLFYKLINIIHRKGKGQGIDHVNVKEVNKAIEKLKAGKAPDEDGISAEHYKYGMDELTPFIVHLLNLILTYLDVPIFLKTGILTPILKKEKDKTLPSSYRGITVTKIFAKILQSILKDRVDSVFNNIQNSLQRGFTEGVSSLCAAFLTSEAIEESKKLKILMILITLDAEKAFDKLKHEILFNKLYHYGIKGKLWILLRNLYKGMSIKVKWEGQCTEDVMVLQGIQQGAKLSTTLYKCYNNVILDSILKSGLGACIGDIQVPAPTCADDIAFLANSTADAQGIFDIVLISRRVEPCLIEGTVKSSIIVLTRRTSQQQHHCPYKKDRSKAALSFSEGPVKSSIIFLTRRTDQKQNHCLYKKDRSKAASLSLQEVPVKSSIIVLTRRTGQKQHHCPYKKYWLKAVSSSLQEGTVKSRIIILTRKTRSKAESLSLQEGPVTSSILVLTSRTGQKQHHCPYKTDQSKAVSLSQEGPVKSSIIVPTRKTRSKEESLSLQEGKVTSSILVLTSRTGQKQHHCPYKTDRSKAVSCLKKKERSKAASLSLQEGPHHCPYKKNRSKAVSLSLQEGPVKSSIIVLTRRTGQKQHNCPYKDRSKTAPLSLQEEQSASFSLQKGQVNSSIIVLTERTGQKQHHCPYKKDRSKAVSFSLQEGSVKSRIIVFTRKTGQKQHHCPYMKYRLKAVSLSLQEGPTQKQYHRPYKKDRSKAESLSLQDGPFKSNIIVLTRRTSQKQYHCPFKKDQVKSRIIVLTRRKGHKQHLSPYKKDWSKAVSSSLQDGPFKSSIIVLTRRTSQKQYHCPFKKDQVKSRIIVLTRRKGHKQHLSPYK
ncbi:unnamed protein product [Mytilus coruscus]|uniref:Reverse transcriptase domain-containing protein n=1 Tax=Mytilus coruscus TaxID=42192 RepID=A0A6J7ZWM3_MYTCO|nr:unnamed protein product [Mytilus coruscus]